MSVDAEVIEMTLESTLTSADTAVEVVTKLCREAGFDEEQRDQVGMAVHESMINAVYHGNGNDASKRVWLRLQAFPDRVEINIRDQGSGFDLSRVPDPLESENLLKVSGRGIFLIRSFVDEFRVYHHEGHGTEVLLVKRKNKNTEQRGKAS